jgi:hypothetical protein
LGRILGYPKMLEEIMKGGNYILEWNKNYEYYKTKYNLGVFKDGKFQCP